MTMKFYFTILILLSPTKQIYNNSIAEEFYNFFYENRRVDQDRRVLLALGCSVFAVSCLVYNYYKNLGLDNNLNSSDVIPPSKHINQRSAQKNNTDINKLDVDGFTALHRAIYNNSAVDVKKLLQDGADTEIIDRSGSYPILIAICKNNPEIVQLLFEYGANTETVGHNDQVTPLFFAIDHGYIQIVQTLILHKANVNACTKDGLTPLEYAIIKGNVKIIEMLIAAGANVNVKYINDATLLQRAFYSNNFEIIKTLILHGADIHARMSSGTTSLHEAVYSDLFEIVQMLIASQVDVNTKDSRYGLTPLHLAAWNNNAKIVKELLKHGAQVNAVNTEGRTSLHYAFGHIDNNIEIIQILLEYGAHINAQDKDGNTPLHLAVLYGSLEAVEILIKNNADVTIKNNDQKKADDYIDQRLISYCPVRRNKYA
jgi:ankyrin repeat protein